jgi:hypothetical protein
MSITFTGYMHPTKDLSPRLKGTVLYALLGTAPENMKRADILELEEVFNVLPAGDPTKTLNQLLTPYV